MSTIATQDIIEIHKAGNCALKKALGHDGAQTFLKLCRGSGDFTKERHENPPTHDEVVEGMRRLQPEYITKMEAAGVRIEYLPA